MAVLQYMKKGGIKWTILIIIIILAIVYILLNRQNVISVSAATNLTVPLSSSAYFTVKGSGVYALYLKNSSPYGSDFYLSKAPVLEGPIESFSLSKSAAANVSLYSIPSSNADLQVKLLYSNNSTAKVELTPTPSGFSVRSSDNVNIVNPAGFQSGGPAAGTTMPTTTIPSTPSAASTATTTVKQTTTVSQVSFQSVLIIANSTYIGTLMNNYKTLYIKGSGCTQNVYSTDMEAYASQYSQTGPFTFQNASATTPTNINVNVAEISTNLYFVNYSTISPSTVTTGPAAGMTINITSGITSNVVFKGIYLGQNYTVVNKNYQFQNGIPNACGAYIP